MTRDDLANLSFTNLRALVKTRRDELNAPTDLNFDDIFRYLLDLPPETQTPDSIEALILVSQSLYSAAQPTEALQGAAHAARISSVMGEKALLCHALHVQGMALTDLGRFAEAMVTNAEALSIARGLRDAWREISSIGSLGQVCVAMAQWDVAARYYEQARALAEEKHENFLELLMRFNLADCFLQLRDASSGLRALGHFPSSKSQTRRDLIISVGGFNILARLHLLGGDVESARIHAAEASRVSEIAKDQRQAEGLEATLGLIDVLSGSVDIGLARVERSLDHTKRINKTDVPDRLGACIEAYEAAGRPDEAMRYLEELFELRKKSVETYIAQMPSEGSVAPLSVRTDSSLAGGELVVKAQQLRATIEGRLQRFVETAINAEITSGHDLYRTFRVAKLARLLAADSGFSEQRCASLAVGAQLCNVGMMAIPVRILQKRRGLSAAELLILRDHTKYGAEILRRSKLRILEAASVIAAQHHERYDGSGYPNGLCGEEIGEEARIVAICDSFDAMTHRRPWREAPLSVQAALNEVSRGAASQFDPTLARLFVDLVRREFWKHEDFDAFLADDAHEQEYVRDRARIEKLLKNDQDKL
jgi:putative two-component system response regulator